MVFEISCFVGSFPKRRRLRSLRRAIAEAWRDFGFLSFRFAADEEASGAFLEGTKRKIDQAFLCLFDVSEVWRSDVLLEIGYALGRGKESLFVLKQGHRAPAVLAGIRPLTYSSLSDLTHRLSDHGVFPPVVRAALRWQRERRGVDATSFHGELFSTVGQGLGRHRRLDASRIYELASDNGYSEEQILMTLDVLETVGLAEREEAEWIVAPAGNERLPRLLDELDVDAWAN